MITLIPIGEIEEGILEDLRRRLTEAFGQGIELGNNIELNESSQDKHRRQYFSSKLLAEIPSPSDPGNRALGIVDVDIFTSGLNFVFGEADITGRKAIISLQRLRQEFYNLPKNENLFQERMLKEAVHELGHTYGLRHCANPACVMHFSNSLRDTDLKSWNFCSVCQRKVGKK